MIVSKVYYWPLSAAIFPNFHKNYSFGASILFIASGIVPDNRGSSPTIGDHPRLSGMVPNYQECCASGIIAEGLRYMKTRLKEQKSFDSIKLALTSDRVMAYFDQTKQTELLTDASPKGLSAILSQITPGQEDRKVVAYVSRSLSDVERRYSQTEKEALAIVWAIERLHIYLYGAKFKLFTDCKPVELILSNPKSRPPARIECWNLRIQDYDFEIVYKQGAQNPSDFLSRHTFTDTTGKSQSSTADKYVNFLARHAVPKSMDYKEIQDATFADQTLQALIRLIHDNSWNNI